MALDTGLLSQDSLYLAGPTVAAYHLDGNFLILPQDTLDDADTLTWDGSAFVSNWEHAYGRVVLVPGGDQHCRMHAPVH
jgi:hypothetical protein